MKALNAYILEKLVITKKTIEHSKAFMTGERVLAVGTALTQGYGLFYTGIIDNVEGNKIHVAASNNDLKKLSFEMINDPDKKYSAISPGKNWVLYHADIAINELEQYTQNHKNTVFGYKLFLTIKQAQVIIDFLKKDNISLDEKLVINKDSIKSYITDDTKFYCVLPINKLFDVLYDKYHNSDRCIRQSSGAVLFIVTKDELKDIIQELNDNTTVADSIIWKIPSKYTTMSEFKDDFKDRESSYYQKELDMVTNVQDITEKLVINKDSIKNYNKDDKSDDYLIDANNWNVNDILYCYDTPAGSEIEFYIIKEINKQEIKNARKTWMEIEVKSIGYQIVNNNYAIPNKNDIKSTHNIKFVIVKSGNMYVLRIMGSLMRLYDDQKLTQYKES